jgi:hypothetical protein
VKKLATLFVVSMAAVSIYGMVDFVVPVLVASVSG